MPQEPDQRPPKRSAMDTSDDTPRKKLKQPSLAPLEALPAELFCQVLSFVGPTSSTLVKLSELNKHMNYTMNAIGRAMLPRAKSNFRTPLEPQAPRESCTSLFVRHARTCSSILDQLTQLRVRLNDSASNDVAELDVCMDTALRLLKIGPTLSVSLERQVLSTAGKCGGKAFKLCKSTILEEHLTEEQVRANQERLDRARLIMQIVVFRDLQISKQSPSNLSAALVQNQQVVKKTLSMGCF